MRTPTPESPGQELPAGASFPADDAAVAPSAAPPLSRRGLLRGGAALAAVVTAGRGLPAAPRPALASTLASTLAAADPAVAPPASPPGAAAAPAMGRDAAQRRARRALEVRLAAARLNDGLPFPAQITNGDADAYPGWIACYSKGLPHNRSGEVDADAYRLLLRALASGQDRDFEAIPLGGFAKLANPQAALGFNLTGPDPARTELVPPPRFASDEQGAEMAELYWQALLRDIPFTDYDTDPLAARAAADLSQLPGLAAPRAGGGVMPRTLFRGAGEAHLAGPYLSQFLYKDIFLPPIWVPQKQRTVVPGVDYLTAYDNWLANQNGALSGVVRFDPQPRHLRNGRDLGEFVHRDFSFQAALDAALILLKMGAPANGGNPYKHSRTQSGFATFGPPYLFYLIAVATQAAITASWYQKWCVHRRLRPEEYAGRVEVQRKEPGRYPLPKGLLASAALSEVTRRHGTALLPQAYPEGCPLHPSYPAAHAVLTAAGVTVLKAFFDESFVVPSPVIAAAGGLALVPYAGPPLTIGGELDKLAWNIGMGRNFAGIHWRSDVAAGARLGEDVAIAVLREMKLTGNELFSGFHLRRFDGTRLTI